MQVCCKPLGFDREHNRYWLLRGKEPSTVDDSLLFVEINGGSFASTAAAVAPAIIGTEQEPAMTERWVQVVSEEELNALLGSLEEKGARESVLRSRRR